MSGTSKQLLRLSSRRAATATCPNPAVTVKHYSQHTARSYHHAPTPSTSHASAANLFDASYPGPHKATGQQSAASPCAPAPYNDLLHHSFPAPTDVLVTASCQQTSLPSSSNPFLPFYSSAAQSEPAGSGPSGLLGVAPRRSENKTASLCFRRNGASGIAKRKTVESRMGSRSLPASLPGFRPAAVEADLRVLKSVQVGEDAYFCRSDSLGVADGVGGWSGKKGADPAMFSRLLMHYCATGLERYDDVDDPLFLDYYNVDPVDVMSEASLQALEEAKQKQFTGSSTALIAVLRRDVLRVANLGDCNCAIIRGTDYLFRSEEQQHSFNYPMQVGTQSRDTAKKDAQRFDVKVQKDDIVILSSDGLVDNLFEEDILEEVLRFSYPSFDPTHPDSGQSAGKQAAFSPQAVSEALCSRAKAVIEDPLAVNSPFQQRAMEEGMYYTGGKPDDITVLVAVIGEERDSEDRR